GRTLRHRLARRARRRTARRQADPAATRPSADALWADRRGPTRARARDADALHSPHLRVPRPFFRRTGRAQPCDDAPRVALRAPTPAAPAGPPDRRRPRFLAARRHRRPHGAADPAQLKALGACPRPPWAAGNNL